MSTPAVAQVTSLESNIPIQRGHDPDKMVCEVDQTTGTRLGARKVCKTVLEWQQMRSEHRETVEDFERRNTSVGCQTGNPCSGGMGPH
ncbi:MAG: hypothetical protein ACTHOI_07405 [Sphingomicrobium sp.]